jgi:hypothetical protein
MSTSILHWAATVALAGALLAACGKAEPPAPAPASTAAKPAAKIPGGDGGASAEEVAKQARGALVCPPKATTPPRAAGAPVDDMLGVRPGLGYDEAMEAVLCANPLLVATPTGSRGFNLKAPLASTVRQGFTARSAEPRVVKSSKQIMKELQDDAMARGGNAVREDLKPGQSKWFVATMGLQGQERVLGVTREERFASEQSPTVESVHAALLKKYGTPSHDQPAAASSLPLLRWSYDPQGQLVTVGSPLFHRCTGTSDPNGSMHVTPECGVVVQAVLVPQKTNPELVDRLQVGIVDQALGYRLIGATEQGLAQLDQRRRAQEVDKAARNGKAPSL